MAMFETGFPTIGIELTPSKLRSPLEFAVPVFKIADGDGGDMDFASTASAPDRLSAPADGSWMAWTAAGIAGIWIAVTVISVFAPDMVTGSEQEHLPAAAFATWLWGLVSTGAFVWAMGKLRGSATRRPIWIGLATATLTVWMVATILSLSLPVVETGSDPTRIPIGALVAPVAATVLTVLAGITATVFSRQPEPPPV
jgi:hypothetical protein